jgi:hypothetical protein
MAWSRAGQVGAVVVGPGPLIGQRHRLVHRQRRRQRLGRLGRPHAHHRVVQHQAVAAPPGVQAAPGRQRNGDAARPQALPAQRRHPAAHVVHLGLLQFHPSAAAERCSRTSASWYMASVRASQALLHPQVLR